MNRTDLNVRHLLKDLGKATMRGKKNQINIEIMMFCFRRSQMSQMLNIQWNQRKYMQK